MKSSSNSVTQPQTSIHNSQGTENSLPHDTVAATSGHQAHSIAGETSSGWRAKGDLARSIEALRKSRAPVWKSKRELEHSRTELARLIEGGFSNDYLLLGLSRLVTSLVDFDKAVDESDEKCADAIETSYSCITAQRSVITSQTEDGAKVQQTGQAPTDHTSGHQQAPPTRAFKGLSSVNGKDGTEQSRAEERTSSEGSSVSIKSPAGDSNRDPAPGDTFATTEQTKVRHRPLLLTGKQVKAREEPKTIFRNTNLAVEPSHAWQNFRSTPVVKSALPDLPISASPQSELRGNESAETINPSLKTSSLQQKGLGSVSSTLSRRSNTVIPSNASSCPKPRDKDLDLSAKVHPHVAGILKTYLNDRKEFRAFGAKEHRGVDDMRITLAWKTDSTPPQKSKWQIAVPRDKRGDVLREASYIASIALGMCPGNLLEIGLTGGFEFDQGWLNAVKLKHARNPKNGVRRTWVDYRWYPEAAQERS